MGVVKCGGICCIRGGGAAVWRTASYGWVFAVNSSVFVTIYC